jgi:hypothetical protein
MLLLNKNKHRRRIEKMIYATKQLDALEKEKEATLKTLEQGLAAERVRSFASIAERAKGLKYLTKLEHEQIIEKIPAEGTYDYDGEKFCRISLVASQEGLNGRFTIETEYPCYHWLGSSRYLAPHEVNDILLVKPGETTEKIWDKIPKPTAFLYVLEEEVERKLLSEQTSDLIKKIIKSKPAPEGRFLNGCKDEIARASLDFENGTLYTIFSAYYHRSDVNKTEFTSWNLETEIEFKDKPVPADMRMVGTSSYSDKESPVSNPANHPAIESFWWDVSSTVFGDGLRYPGREADLATRELGNRMLASLDLALKNKGAPLKRHKQ